MYRLLLYFAILMEFTAKVSIVCRRAVSTFSRALWSAV